MPNALDKEEILRQNLTDAGCDDALIAECLCCFHLGTIDRVLPKLRAYRKCVLTDIRRRQKQLDCLDYLTSRITNEYKKER